MRQVEMRMPAAARRGLACAASGLLLAVTLPAPRAGAVAADAAPASAPASPAAAPGPASAAAPAPGSWRDPKTGVEFVRVPGGQFAMGSSLPGNAGPVHAVRVREFWLGRSEVTQAQWRQVVGTSPAAVRGCDDCPVERVSWNDVQEFLRSTGYRLPTEAEWEYAAGGGVAHQRWAGTSDARDLGDYAWYRGNSGRRPHPVCLKRPNLFGLCDMSGNVYEWCADWYEEGYYRTSPAENPEGPPLGRLRVARGGSWILDPMIAGVTLRLPSPPSARHPYIGFRVALRGAPPPTGPP